MEILWETLEAQFFTAVGRVVMVIIEDPQDVTPHNSDLISLVSHWEPKIFSLFTIVPSLSTWRTSEEWRISTKEVI